MHEAVVAEFPDRFEDGDAEYPELQTVQPDRERAGAADSPGGPVETCPRSAMKPLDTLVRRSSSSRSGQVYCPSRPLSASVSLVVVMMYSPISVPSSYTLT
jgi:hypothetical protein